MGHVAVLRVLYDILKKPVIKMDIKIRRWSTLKYMKIFHRF
jgi:hypothetical protein